MAFNLKEYIIYRTEVKRELFNGEVDDNFKAVATRGLTIELMKKVILYITQ